MDKLTEKEGLAIVFTAYLIIALILTPFVAMRVLSDISYPASDLYLYQWVMILIISFFPATILAGMIMLIVALSIAVVGSIIVLISLAIQVAKAKDHDNRISGVITNERD